MYVYVISALLQNVFYSVQYRTSRHEFDERNLECESSSTSIFFKNIVQFLTEAARDLTYRDIKPRA